MNSRQVECFITIVEQKSFSKAASLLYLSQSVVSYQIRLLEKEIGFPLFLRDRHPVQLTDGGELFYKALLDSKQAIEKSVNLGKAWYKKASNLVNISIISIIDPVQVAGFLNICKQAIPDIQINLVPYILTNPINQIRNQDIDIFIIIRDEVNNNDEFQTIPLYFEQDYCWLGENHHLASKSHITARDIKDEEIILMENIQEQKLSTHIFDELLLENPNPKFHYVSTFDNIEFGLILANSCITLVPTKYNFSPICGIKSISYGNDYPICICAAWRIEDNSVNTKKCIDLIVDYFRV